MKALLLSKYRQLEITDLPSPIPAPDEVLIRVSACGICGSDVHGYDGSSGRRIPPIVMGHEAAGIVAAVGKNVRKVTEGERVTFDSTVFCGACRFVFVEKSIFATTATFSEFPAETIAVPAPSPNS
jgi:L-iditol 2-dehydrogenase